MVCGFESWPLTAHCYWPRELTRVVWNLTALSHCLTKVRAAPPHLRISRTPIGEALRYANVNDDFFKENVCFFEGRRPSSGLPSAAGRGRGELCLCCEIKPRWSPTTEWPA